MLAQPSSAHKIARTCAQTSVQTCLHTRLPLCTTRWICARSTGPLRFARNRKEQRAPAGPSWSVLGPCTLPPWISLLEPRRIGQRCTPVFSSSCRLSKQCGCPCGHNLVAAQSSCWVLQKCRSLGSLQDEAEEEEERCRRAIGRRPQRRSAMSTVSSRRSRANDSESHVSTLFPVLRLFRSAIASICCTHDGSQLKTHF